MSDRLASKRWLCRPHVSPPAGTGETEEVASQHDLALGLRLVLDVERRRAAALVATDLQAARDAADVEAADEASGLLERLEEGDVVLLLTPGVPLAPPPPPPAPTPAPTPEPTAGPVAVAARSESASAARKRKGVKGGKRGKGARDVGDGGGDGGGDGEGGGPQDPPSPPPPPPWPDHWPQHWADAGLTLWHRPPPDPGAAAARWLQVVAPQDGAVGWNLLVWRQAFGPGGVRDADRAAVVQEAFALLGERYIDPGRGFDAQATLQLNARLAELAGLAFTTAPVRAPEAYAQRGNAARVPWSATTRRLT